MILFINTTSRKAASSREIKHIPFSLCLNDVKIYLTDGPFTTNVGIVNLQPIKKTHWDA